MSSQAHHLPAATAAGIRTRRFSATRLAVGVAATAVALAVPTIMSPPAMAACRIDQPCVPNPTPRPVPIPPKPVYSPDLFIDVARETTTLDGVHVVGWTADADLPTSPLQVDIAVDGLQVQTVTASVDRPDVGAAHPLYGNAHGFDLTLPVSDADHSISVTSHNFGSGSNVTRSVSEDRIKGFAANTIDYDLPHAVILANTPEELNRIDYVNGSSRDQTWELDLGGSTQETSGWQNTQNVDVSLQTDVNVGVPVFADGKVSVKVEGSLNWQQNAQVQVTKTWDFKQTTTVPANSELVATSSVSQATLNVPYVMHGSFVYMSGYTAPGTTTGTYRGTNSHDMTIRLTETALASGTTVTSQQSVVPDAVSFGMPQPVTQ